MSNDNLDKMFDDIKFLKNYLIGDRVIDIMYNAVKRSYPTLKESRLKLTDSDFANALRKYRTDIERGF